MIAGSCRAGTTVAMSNPPISLDGLRALLLDPTVAAGEDPVVVVDLDHERPDVLPVLHSGVARVVVGLSAAADQPRPAGVECCDVVLHPDDGAGLAAIRTTVASNPLAAMAVCLVLRGAETRSIDDGLLVESATYSALQAGPELARWRATRPRRTRDGDDGPRVVLDRQGGRLDIVLSRPAARNALDTRMRDELVEAFRLPALDDSITEVHLSAEGPSFCAGGDLDEFGSFADPASAHVVRLQQSAGRAIAEVAERVTAHLHGACAGSGIELPAFARRVVAAPDTSISLPELGLGLIPGAGGTVSLPARIGRHRTARLALTGERIDAATAHRWGLVDEIRGAAEA